MVVKPCLFLAIILISILVSVPILQAYSAILIRINEFEFNPPGPIAENQWIELYNPDETLLDLSGWLIKSTRLGKTVSIPDGFVIEPNKYLVIPFKSIVFDTENESIVLLTPDSVEVDRTPTLSDIGDDDRTWQRFPNGIDTDTPTDWSFRNSTFGLPNGAPAVKPNFTLSDPIFIDQQGNKVSAFIAGQMAGVKSEIVNQFSDERTFAYIIQIKNEEGFPVFISWVEDITILPNRAIKPAIFWLAETRGEFLVQVFVWRSLNIAEPLTPQKIGLLRVAG